MEQCVSIEPLFLLCVVYMECTLQAFTAVPAQIQSECSICTCYSLCIWLYVNACQILALLSESYPSMCSSMLLAMKGTHNIILAYPHSSYHSYAVMQLCILLLHINTRFSTGTGHGIYSATHWKMKNIWERRQATYKCGHINVHTIQTTQLATYMYIKTCIHTCTHNVHPVTLRIKVVKKKQIL